MRWMWIDRIVSLEPGKRLVAIKNISLAEDHLHDHAPGMPFGNDSPIMPATLMIEGMAQTAGILVGHTGGFREKVILAKISRADFSRDAGPGQTLRYTAEIERMDPTGASTAGTVELLEWSAQGVQESTIGRVDLLFSHLDQNLQGIEFPEENFVFGESFKTLLRLSGIPVQT